MTRTVARICRALDGLPLAIELAASRSQSLSPAQIEDQLAQPLSIGARALRDLPDRQQSLQATIRWSYDLLTAGAQEVLRDAAVFLGGFTVAGAARRSPDGPVRAELDELLEASLVRRQADGDRFELLELVRAFALGRARGAASAGAEARARHRRYFAARRARRPARRSTRAERRASSQRRCWPITPTSARRCEDAIEAGDQESAIALALGLRPVWLAGMLRQESPGARRTPARPLLDPRRPTRSHSARGRVPRLQPEREDLASPARGRRRRDRRSRGGWRWRPATCSGWRSTRRDRDEMRRLRPSLLALITPETSATERSAGPITSSRSTRTSTGGWTSACEHASLSAEKAQEIGHEVMLASAVGDATARADGSRSTRSRSAALAEALELHAPVRACSRSSAFALWLVARYAAGVAPGDGRAVARACRADRRRARLPAVARERAARRDGRRCSGSRISARCSRTRHPSTTRPPSRRRSPGWPSETPPSWPRASR